MLKKLIPVFLIMTVHSLLVFAQSKEEKAVADAVEALRKAMVDADSVMLHTLTHEALSYGHSSGKVEDKATFIENIMNGNSDFVAIELTDQTIRVSGNTAIVRHKFHAGTNDKSRGPGQITLSILTVWKKNKGHWILLARQAVRV